MTGVVKNEREISRSSVTAASSAISYQRGLIPVSGLTTLFVAWSSGRINKFERELGEFVRIGRIRPNEIGVASCLGRDR